jgi:hypothetical protein
VTIQPDAMANLQEIDDGDGDPRTRVFVVPMAEPMEHPVEPVTVRSTLAPSLSESQLPAGWTLQGGTGAAQLTRTVDRTVSAGASRTEFTFTCDGTDSGLKTTVYVIRAGLIPDWNHDRVIDDDDKDQAMVLDPFRFWINDDDDFGDISEDDSDVPGQGGLFDNANYEDDEVNGRSDLLDFFRFGWTFTTR